MIENLHPMSVSTLTTIAAVREAESRKAKAAHRPPQRTSKGDIGKVPPGHADAKQAAGVTDVLASQLPTELIAPYTALTAALVGASTPTDQLAWWRWVAFILLLVAVPIATWIGTGQKSGTWTFPWLAVLAAEVAAVAWAFLMPGSPLVPYLHSAHARTLVPLYIAVGGTVLASVTAALLTTTPGQFSFSDLVKKFR